MSSYHIHSLAWLTHSALKLAKAVADLDVYIEQPCKTYAECKTVRAHTDLPFILVSACQMGKMVSINVLSLLSEPESTR